MKHIQKQNEPQEFIDWKKKKKNPTYERFKKTKKVRIPVKEALIKEQGGLCCYCERQITLDNSHIEHFKPKSDKTVDPLDFQNLLCSCQRELAEKEPRHCGNAKGDYDPTLLISPLESTCATHFIFDGDGNIGPKENTDRRAVNTIKQLQLNIPKLIALRQGAIGLFLDSRLSDDELKTFIEGYLSRSQSGYYSEFWTTIDFLFGGLLA
ncbi:retron system putative HNH endonuclease [cf. Phormidesmis sp. LEGE 11477]|uniref:retron system putative HNH endonuclease n=1 Tax=cf. Phormidesmis sp. LEGE 11477 TaxID=1828680 RepID=UPI0018809444|nr:retron system putative HNH endonuclease [cf. Phormidesmis sp. LEGE 11477]MBE9064137.1 TIGR02646 family protein [cf. Phormidesmis sp. LEGE 11477]